MSPSKAEQSEARRSDVTLARAKSIDNLGSEGSSSKHIDIKIEDCFEVHGHFFESIPICEFRYIHRRDPDLRLRDRDLGTRCMVFVSSQSALSVQNGTIIYEMFTRCQ